MTTVSEKINCEQLKKFRLYVPVFIQLSVQGDYLIFRLSGWALFRGGPSFEAGHLLNFHQQIKSLFCNKTINKNKT